MDYIQISPSAQRKETTADPQPQRGQIHMPETDKSMPKASIQNAFRSAMQKARITKSVSLRHLRHAGVYPASLAGPSISLKPG